MISNMNGLDIFFKDDNEELLAGITIHLPSIFTDKPDIKLEVYDKNLM